jgi:ammonium transporter Rh
MQVEPSAANEAQKSLRIFALMLIFFEVIVLLLFVAFVRILPFPPDTYDRLYMIRYGAFQDINIMMLIGFGFLMTFMRNYSLASLAYTFFVNVIILQVYLFFSRFWF